MTQQLEAMKLALEAAYLAGFNESYEGYNGEYPFGDKKQDPTENRNWKKARDNYVSQAIEQAQKQCQCPACKIKPHASDCPVHNEPAWPNGPCDCGAIEQAQKQKPVAWLIVHKSTNERFLSTQPNNWNNTDWFKHPLYTSPPQRQPMTESERFQLRCQWNPDIHGALHDYLIEQTEAAHGIKGEA